MHALESMITRKGPVCLSDYELDGLVMDAYSDAAAEPLRRRLAQCPHCRKRLAQFEQAHEAFQTRNATSMLFQRPRAETPFMLPSAVLALTAAAAVLLWVQTHPTTPQTETTGTRTKGGDYFGYLIVDPQGFVRGDETSETAVLGDELQWRFRVRQDRYVAVVATAENGSVSVYLPETKLTGSRTAATGNQVLDIAARPTGEPGPQKIYGLVCAEPPDPPSIVAKSPLTFPASCEVHERTVLFTDRRAP